MIISLVREILVYEPWNDKHGSPEQGLIRKRVAESSNKMKEPKFRVGD